MIPIRSIKSLDCIHIACRLSARKLFHLQLKARLNPSKLQAPFLYPLCPSFLPCPSVAWYCCGVLSDQSYVIVGNIRSKLALTTSLAPTTNIEIFALICVKQTSYTRLTMASALCLKAFAESIYTHCLLNRLFALHSSLFPHLSITS